MDHLGDLEDFLLEHVESLILQTLDSLHFFMQSLYVIFALGLEFPFKIVSQLLFVL